MIDIIANADKINVIGRLGENEHCRLMFPIAEYLAMYPGAVVSLLNRLPGVDTAYPVATTTTDSEYLYWTVTSADLTREGQGQCELVVMQDNVVAKSVIYITRVLTALDGSGEAPEPWDEWQLEFARMKAETEAAAQSVQDMGVEAETLAPGSEATVEKTVDPETGVVTLGFGIPSGADGPPGVSPIVTVTEIAGGHRVTITDTTRTWTIDLMNGRGIASAVLNADYTLTLTFTDGTTYTTPSLRGVPGEDGVSPTVSVAVIDGGHRVTITDAEGPKTFDVTNGESYVLTQADKAEIAGMVDVPVQSVAGKTGAVTLDAGDVGFDDQQTYGEGTVGKNVSELKSQMGDKIDAPATPGTSGQVLTSDGQGGQSWQTPSGGGTVDDELSTTSTNPVQNKVIAGALDEVYEGKEVIIAPSINKLNPNEVLLNTLIHTNGSLTTNNNYQTTGKIIPDSGATHVAFSGNNAAGTARVCLSSDRIAYYRADDSLISYEAVSTRNVGTIPSGTAYLRMSCVNDYMNNRSPMVEFVDSANDISATFVEYSEGYEEHKPGLISLNRNVNGAIGEPQTIDNLAIFARGGINSTTGAYDSYYQYRITTIEKFIADKTYIFNIASGFRMYIFLFAQDGTKISAAWHTGSATVEKDSIVRLMIARQTETSSEIADIEEYCSKVSYIWEINLQHVSDGLAKVDAIIPYGLTWDWWISANCIDTYGNAYIGYVDTDGYAGVLRRQPDGVMQYKRLESQVSDDDHNGVATTILPNGKVLVIGSHGHGQDNHIVCYRSTKPYSIDEMEKLSFDIPQGSTYGYRTTYSQVFQYNGALFDFCRCVVYQNNSNIATGYICLISQDNGSSWTPYQAVYSSDPYITFAQCSDDNKCLKFVHGVNPASGTNTLKGGIIDLSTYKIYDLNNTEIGQMIALGTGNYDSSAIAKPADMTSLVAQTADGKKGRLFTVAETAKAQTVFLYATAIDSDSSDFTYKLYDNGTIVEIGTSGTPFGNVHYISGMCFGKSTDTIYYAKATTEKADGNHELHKVKIVGGTVESDDIIAESSVCIIRPLFLGNGELTAVVGHYNDQTDNGYNGSFVDWELKPLFVHA